MITHDDESFEDFGEGSLDDREAPDAWDMDRGDEDSVDTEPCPHCHKPVYADAERCPHCGKYVVFETTRRSKTIWYVIVAVICIAAIILFTVYGSF